MKRANNIYNDIFDMKNIIYIYDKRIKLNTKNKHKLEIFENNYVSNTYYIKKILESKKYIPGKYNIFMIKEPKIRLIMSQNVIDKVINHLVSEYFLVNILDKYLIPNNIATRKNKGTHYGIKILKKYLNELKNKEFYILKFDISKYFYNIDHEIIKELLKKRIKDKDALNLLNFIIDSTDYEYVNKTINRLKEKEIEKINKKNINNKQKLIEEIKNIPIYKKGKGLPIGNMTSQFLAIYYLNELDHYINDTLKVKYIRYMDDGILIHESKEYLKYCLMKITNILDKYKLNLNKKTKIYHIKEGFDFLGFRYYIKNGKVIMKVKNQTKKKFKRKMRNLYYLCSKNIISKEEFIRVRNSYLGHLSYGSTRKLVRLEKFNLNEKNIDLGNYVKID